MSPEQKEYNTKIIGILAKAPPSQLSGRLSKMCKNFDGSDEQLDNILRSIYYGCCEASNFCKILVDPEFTYWEPKPGEGLQLHNHELKP